MSMNKGNVIEWIYNLPIQTLTDELKEEIIEAFEMYAKECEK